jgi:hypothetical protein
MQCRHAGMLMSCTLAAAYACPASLVRLITCPKRARFDWQASTDGSLAASSRFEIPTHEHFDTVFASSWAARSHIDKFERRVPTETSSPITGIR